MAYEETGGRVAETKYAMEFDNYSPSAIGDEWSEGFADVPEYESFEEGFQAIFASLKKIFGATDSTKDEAKAKSVTLTTTPTTSPSASTSNITIIAKTEACKAEFAEFGIDVPIQPGDANADINAGQNLQTAIHTAWVDPDAAKTQQALMVTNGIGAEAAKRRGKGETPTEAVAAEFALGLLTLASGRNLNASSVLNLVINGIGKIISRSQNVTQSTKHPKPERSYVSQQNAQQQKQAAAALAIFTSLAGGAGGKRISTPISGAFRANTFGGLTGSFQPDQGIVYEFPVENSAGEIEYVLDKDLQARYGTNPSA